MFSITLAKAITGYGLGINLNDPFEVVLKNIGESNKRVRAAEADFEKAQAFVGAQSEKKRMIYEAQKNLKRVSEREIDAQFSGLLEGKLFCDTEVCMAKVFLAVVTIEKLWVNYGTRDGFGTTVSKIVMRICESSNYDMLSFVHDMVNFTMLLDGLDANLVERTMRVLKLIIKTDVVYKSVRTNHKFLMNLGTFVLKRGANALMVELANAFFCVHRKQKLTSFCDSEMSEIMKEVSEANDVDTLMGIAEFISQQFTGKMVNTFFHICVLMYQHVRDNLKEKFLAEIKFVYTSFKSSGAHNMLFMSRTVYRESDVMMWLGFDHEDIVQCLLTELSEVKDDEIDIQDFAVALNLIQYNCVCPFYSSESNASDKITRIVRSILGMMEGREACMDDDICDQMKHAFSWHAQFLIVSGQKDGVEICKMVCDFAIALEKDYSVAESDVMDDAESLPSIDEKPMKILTDVSPATSPVEGAISPAKTRWSDAPEDSETEDEPEPEKVVTRNPVKLESGRCMPVPRTQVDQKGSWAGVVLKAKNVADTTEVVDEQPRKLEKSACRHSGDTCCGEVYGAIGQVHSIGKRALAKAAVGSNF